MVDQDRRDLIIGLGSAAIGALAYHYLNGYKPLFGYGTSYAEIFRYNVNKLIFDMKDNIYFGNVNRLDFDYVLGDPSFSGINDLGIAKFLDDFTANDRLKLKLAYIQLSDDDSTDFGQYLDSLKASVKENVEALFPSLKIEVETEKKIIDISSSQSQESMLQMVAYLYEPKLINLVASPKTKQGLLNYLQNSTGGALTQYTANGAGLNFTISEIAYAGSGVDAGLTLANSLKAIAGFMGIPNCYEPQCFMSKNELYQDASFFGRRCRLIGSRFHDMLTAKGNKTYSVNGNAKDLYSEQIVLPAIDAETAMADYEEHLKDYIEPQTDIHVGGYKLDSESGDFWDASTFTFKDDSKAKITVNFNLTKIEIVN